MAAAVKSGISLLWEISDAGVREVYAAPAAANCTVWSCVPVDSSSGRPVRVLAADIAPTEEVALLLWHERRGDSDVVAEITARIGARYRASRDAHGVES